MIKRILGNAEERAIPSAKDQRKATQLRYAPILSLAILLGVFAAWFMFRNDPGIWFYDQASELTCLAHSILSGRGLSSPFGGSTGPSAFLALGYMHEKSIIAPQPSRRTLFAS